MFRRDPGDILGHCGHLRVSGAQIHHSPGQNLMKGTSENSSPNHPKKVSKSAMRPFQHLQINLRILDKRVRRHVQKGHWWRSWTLKPIKSSKFENEGRGRIFKILGKNHQNQGRRRIFIFLIWPSQNHQNNLFSTLRSSTRI